MGKLIITIFYFLFGLSLLDNPMLDKLRYIALAFLIVMYLLSAKKFFKLNSIDKVLLYAILSIGCSMFGVALVSNFGFQSILKILSILCMFICTLIIIPQYIEIIGKEKHIIILMKVISILFFISFLIAPFEMVSSGGGRVANDIRLKLFFKDPNSLGNLGSVYIILYVLYLYWGKKYEYKTKKVYAILVLPILYFMNLANSRTAIYTLIIFLIVLGFYSIKNQMTRVILFISTSICAILGMSYLYTKGALNFYILDNILSWRLTYIKNALNSMNRKELLFGKGAFLNSNLGDSGLILVDNSYINIIYQFGIIVFVMVMIYVIILSIKAFKTKDPFVKAFIITFYINCFLENIIINVSGFYTIIFYSLVIHKILFNRTEKIISERRVIHKRRKIRIVY